MRQVEDPDHLLEIAYIRQIGSSLLPELRLVALAYSGSLDADI